MSEQLFVLMLAQAIRAVSNFRAATDLMENDPKHQCCIFAFTRAFRAGQRLHHYGLRRNSLGEFMV
tara:strand:- start:266 stop:463 length:198 start_codon:yes stop_codon:yes gene_type:complete